MTDALKKYTKRQLAEIIVDLVGKKRDWELRHECSLPIARCEEIVQLTHSLKATK